MGILGVLESADLLVPLAFVEGFSRADFWRFEQIDGAVDLVWEHIDNLYYHPCLMDHSHNTDTGSGRLKRRLSGRVAASGQCAGMSLINLIISNLCLCL